MGLGIGNIANNQQRPPAAAPGPPFPANSANSGLHVSPGGVIQLGSDAGANPLLQSTDIEQAGFPLFATNAGSTTFKVDPANGLFVLGDDGGAGNGNKLFIDDISRFSILGDATGIGNGTAVGIDDANGQIKIGDRLPIQSGALLQIDTLAGNTELQFFDTGGRYLDIFPLRNYRLGDIDGQGAGYQLFIDGGIGTAFVKLGDTIPLGSGLLLSIDEATQLMFMGDPAGTGIDIDVSTAGGIIQAVLGTNPYLLLDGNAKVYQIGDFTNTGNDSFITVDDAGSAVIINAGFSGNPNMELIFDAVLGTFILQFGGDRQFSIDVLNGRYQIGDLSGIVNQMKLDINDASGFASLGGGPLQGMYVSVDGVNINANISSGSDRYLDIDVPTDLYRFGDMAPATNGSYFAIDNALQTFTWFSTVATPNIYSFYDIPNQLFQWGDVSGVSAGSLLQLQCAPGSEQLTFFGANGIRTSGDAILMHTLTALSNAAGASLGTLTNAPAAGNPTKWITVDDNGTPRRIPTW